MAPTNGETVLPLLGDHAHPTWNLRASFSAPLAVVAVALLGAFIGLVKYPELTSTDAHVNQYYMYYIHVAIMIYIGFGYLMTFLRCAPLHLTYAARVRLSTLLDTVCIYLAHHQHPLLASFPTRALHLHNLMDIDRLHVNCTTPNVLHGMCAQVR
jgi:hypothetical protein